MKYRYMLVGTLFLVVFWAVQTKAEIKSSDLSRQVTVTEEAALLSQVDAVSLYMKSEKVAFAPRLNNANIIEVETTVLDRNLLANSLSLENFVSRTINSFISVLEERLPTYAPSIASKFRKNSDIKFNVNSGSERKPVAIWYAGKWYWDKDWTPSYAPVANYSSSQYYSQPQGQLECYCPARR